MSKKAFSFNLVICFQIKNTIQSMIQDSYALKTGALPTSSCLQQHDVKSTYRCLSTCLKTQQPFRMMSFNNLDQRCLCCVDLTGNIFNDPGWTSYTISVDMCPPGYTYYQTSVFTTCLKYVSTDVTYTDAVSGCKQDGGDLIKIDSQQKFDIFKNHSGQYATLTAIEIWVQGEEVGGQWKFHDGTLIPHSCPISESNDALEVHLRSRSNRDFKCYDAKASNLFHYMCEI